jgi:hypothetical protein
MIDTTNSLVNILNPLILYLIYRFIIKILEREKQKKINKKIIRSMFYIKTLQRLTSSTRPKLMNPFMVNYIEIHISEKLNKYFNIKISLMKKQQNKSFQLRKILLEKQLHHFQFEFSIFFFGLF